MIKNDKSEETLNTEEPVVLDNNSTEVEPAAAAAEATEDDKAKIARLEAAVNALTDSIQNLRAKKAMEALEGEGQSPDLTPDNKPKSEVDDVDKKIQEYFKRERESAKRVNKETALKNFFEKNKEFHPENDITGIRYQSLIKSLSRINMSSSNSVEDFYKDIEDAARLSGLIKENPKQDAPIINKEASMSDTATPPKSTVVIKLTPAQEKIRQESGWTVEKFVKLKTKYPHMFPKD